jgi:hypothetical protein
MVEKVITRGRNVVDFARYQQGRKLSIAMLSARTCRHCGAALGDGEAEEECSSAGFNFETPGLRKFYAE